MGSTNNNGSSSVRDIFGPTPLWAHVAGTYAMMFAAVSIATNSGYVDLGALIVGIVALASLASVVTALGKDSRVVSNIAVIVAAAAGVAIALIV